MQEHIYETTHGPIHYWLSTPLCPDRCTLLFLPGLTADHRLFERQILFFEGTCNLFVWDAPGHASSWPFALDFTLLDLAGWLDEIMDAAHIPNPVIVGQSMGGYIAQAYCERRPSRLKGLICIDSAPLQRAYVTGMELWLLRRMEPIYRHYPWKHLLKSGSNGTAVSAYGRNLMREMMMVYDGDQERYAKLAGHGYRMLADAMAADLPYQIRCPALLICGERDHAGSCIRYNRAWHRKTGIPLQWIPNAGHNANTDAPELVNGLIDQFVKGLSL